MNDTKRRTFALLGVGVLATMLMLALVPGGVAPGHAVACTEPGAATVSLAQSQSYGEIKPLRSDSSVTFDVKYSAPLGYSIRNIPMTITLDSTEDWLAVTPTTYTRNIPAGQPGDGIDENVRVTPTIQVSRDAPFQASAEVTIQVAADAGTCVDPVPATDLEGAPVFAGFYENYNVELRGVTPEAGQNDGVVLPLVITNDGNGDIRVTIDFHERSSKALSMPLPSPISVRNAAENGENNQASVDLEVTTPFKNGYEHRFDDLLLVIKGTPVDDTSIDLTEYQASAVIQTRGVYVPGFEAAFMLFALLGSAFAVMKRR